MIDSIQKGMTMKLDCSNATLTTLAALASEMIRLCDEMGERKDDLRGRHPNAYERCNLQGQSEAFKKAAWMLRDILPTTGKPDDGSEFEVIDPSGSTTFGLSACDAGQWLTDALSLPPEKRPQLLVFKACSIQGA